MSTPVRIAVHQPAPDGVSKYDLLQVQGNVNTAIAQLQSLPSLGKDVAAAPPSSSSPGQAGQVFFDGTSLYICAARNFWVKFTGATF